MEMTGSRRIMAPRDQVWAALNSADVLKICIPGCETFTGSAEQGFEATVRQKIGPVGAAFQGAVLLSNVVAGESYTLLAASKGRTAGLAEGRAEVALCEVEGGTQLDFTVTANIGGKLAQLGDRLIDGFARRMADGFFDGFQLAVEGPIEPAAPADVTDEGAEKRTGWFGRLIGKRA